MRFSSSSSPGGADWPSRAHPLSWRRSLAAGCIAVIALVSLAGPFAVAAAAAGSQSVLGQAQGSYAAPGPSAASSQGSSRAGSGVPASLDPKADFSAPGVDAGRRLIAWAKAGAMVLGTLGLIGGSVVGKLLRQAGNHHAEGVRATAMGISGALVLAGSAATIVSWLMSA